MLRDDEADRVGHQGGRYLVVVPGDEEVDRLADLLHAAGFTAHWSRATGEPREPRRGT